MVLQRPILDLPLVGINLPCVYVHCNFLDMDFAEHLMLNWIGGGQSGIGICALLYIYI